MERLRAGVIGVGAIAQIMHLPYLRELDDRFQIAALCDVDPVVLPEVGRQYGVNRLFASADELLNEPLDVVLILSSGDHGPVTIAALERGLHVLVEKPLAYTLRETNDVIAAAERAGKTLMVGMMKQYDPGYQRGVELVQRLRDLRYVEATTLEPEGTLYHAHHPIVRSSARRQAQEERYGADMFTGIQQSILAREPRELLREATGSDDPSVLTSYYLLIVSSIHDVNALRGAIGQPECVVSASLWAGGTSFTTTLAYANDVRAVYTWTTLPYVKNYGETFGFYASDGRVLIRFPSPYLRNAPTLVDVERMHGEELQVTRFTTSYEEAFKRELLEFDECVRTGRPPRTDAQGFRQDLEVLTEIARKFPATS
ncbi:MAG TPA: Gfo/Idh/MocA family oxidoreductase [Thermomicrobiales bacterium]|nr:Gfo/Idh/MocA family oxidoreductase [Thermomicrobiales bacterium]